MTGAFQALYVHVPFCAARCDYCAFYSVAEAPADLRAAYLRRLDGELADGAARCGELSSVYLGGGTPSSLSAEELDELLSLIGRHWRPAADAELTVECNPASLTPQKVAVLAARGVNRVSLGVQSFRPALRRAIGRRTGIERLPDAMGDLRASGIDNVGLDLIYALPGQTLEDWRDDLERACAMEPRHLSTYELTVEPGTPLAARAPELPDEETRVRMWELAAEVAAGAGLRRYEVSNFAAPGYACRHNVDVWHGVPYLGCGPAASSFDGRLRWTNPAQIPAWLGGAEPAFDALPPEARAAELLGLGLRTTAGWTRAEFAERTAADYAELRGEALAGLAEEGLIEEGRQRVRPTARGLLFGDRVMARLL